MPDEKNLQEAIEVSRRLIRMADDGEMESRDDGCLLFFGILRDCGYRILTAAEREIRMHEGRLEERH